MFFPLRNHYTLLFNGFLCYSLVNIYFFGNCFQSEMKISSSVRLFSVSDCLYISAPLCLELRVYVLISFFLNRLLPAAVPPVSKLIP